MQRGPTTKEIKERFARARKVHVTRIEAEIPLPVVDPQQVAKEVRAGKADVDVVGLKDRLKWARQDEDMEILIPLTTPSLTKWVAETNRAKERRELAIKELDDAMEQFLDRVLFDHENAYLALRDLGKWRGEK